VTVREDLDDDVLVLTFDAPATRNALTRADRARLVQCVAEVDADPGVHAIVLAGRDPAFSSGVDVSEPVPPDWVPPEISPPQAIRTTRTPVIAAVGGVCVGGALEIVLACSFAIGSDHAVFADRHVRSGLTPTWGLSAELPLAIGAARARYLALTGEALSATRAYEWGLLAEMVEHEQLVDRAVGLARQIAQYEVGAVDRTLSLYAESHMVGLRGRLDLERTYRAGNAHPAAGSAR
jgi:enoyl-CoA hydratase